MIERRPLDSVLRARDLLDALEPDADPRARAIEDFERESEVARSWAWQYLAWDAGTD